MRKFLCTALLAALAAAAPASAQTVPTKATLEECRTGEDRLDRVAVFAAEMGSVPGSTRLQVRFDLREKLRGRRWHRVVAPGLGVWATSTADIFRRSKPVIGLQAPANYRAVVRFRWLAGRKVLKRTSRRTPVCRQPDAGPDLRVMDIQVEPTEGNRANYLVIVRNEGRSPAAAFDVALSIAAGKLPPQTLQALDPGVETVVSFTGPRCARGDVLLAAVDPDGRLDERDRADNRRERDCPS
jgi:hypothetical protein